MCFDLQRCKESTFVLTPAVRADERLNSLALGRFKNYTEVFVSLTEQCRSWEEMRSLFNTL